MRQQRLTSFCAVCGVLFYYAVLLEKGKHCGVFRGEGCNARGTYLFPLGWVFAIFCNQTWYCGAPPWAGMSCEKNGILSSRSRSQCGLINSKYDTFYYMGAGIAQWLEHRTRDWKVAGSNPCWNGGRIFFSRVDFLCWLLFRYPFHPRVTTVARKKSRSFCQKYRWQVTAKHAYTLRIEPCFGIGHSLSLICQMTSEDIKHQLNNFLLHLLLVLNQWVFCNQTQFDCRSS